MYNIINFRRIFMSNLSPFCTCKDTDCPMHPSNHNKGCAPCIAKNLKHGEIPNCFFDKLDITENINGYTFEDFADAVKKQNKSKQP